MRLAQNLLTRYRLLFIRHPNNPDTILHHIYSRTLESLITPVDNQHTQLDYLIAKSFRTILTTYSTPNRRNIDEILEKTHQDPLNLFHLLAKDGTDRHRQQWDLIERETLKWWTTHQSIAGYGRDILQGIIKFCRYRDPHKRQIVTRWLAGHPLEEDQLQSIQLPNWPDQISQETFALEALTLLGRLSSLDHPMIIVFDQLEAMFQYPDILNRFGEALKELFTHIPNSLFRLDLFPQRWQDCQIVYDPSIIDRFSQTQLHLQPLPPAQLQTIIQLRLQDTPLNPDLLFPPDDLDDILHQPSLRATLNRASNYYRHRVFHTPLKANPQPLPTSDGQWQQRLLHLETEIRDIRQILNQLLSPARGLSSAFSAALSSPTPVTPPATSSSTTPDCLDQVQAFLTTTRADLSSTTNSPRISSEADDIGKFRHLATCFQTLRPIQLEILRLGKRVLPENLHIRPHQQVISFLYTHGTPANARLKNFNQLTLSRPDLTFRLYRDSTLPALSTKGTLNELTILKNAPNSSYHLFTPSDRILLETLYALTVAITNRDLELDMADALRCVLHLEQHWILDLFQGSPTPQAKP
jgi:hypothetical protein